MKGHNPYLVARKGNPRYILFLFDTSQSMRTQITGMPGNEKVTMVEYASSVLNQAFTYVIHLNMSADNLVVDRFLLGLITYGTPKVPSILPDESGDSDVVTVCEGTLSQIEPLLETYAASITTPEGATSCQLYRFVPKLDSAGGPRETPMADAFEFAAERVKNYLQSSYGKGPIPVVVNITDGDPTDQNGRAEVRARAAANALTSLGNSQGKVLLFNIHITPTFHPGSAEFSPQAPTDPSGKFLYDISSVIPGFMCEHLERQGYYTPSGTRGYNINQGLLTLMKLILQ